jgi:hypothetical protein
MTERNTILIPTQLDLGQLYDIQELIQRGIADLNEAISSESDYTETDISEAKAKEAVGDMVIDGLVNAINILELPVERIKRNKAQIVQMFSAQFPEALDLFQDLLKVINSERKARFSGEEEPDPDVMDFEVDDLCDLISNVIHNLSMSDATPLVFDHAARVLNEATEALLCPEQFQATNDRPSSEGSQSDPSQDIAKWNATVNDQGWNESSQIIHLEGFIREQGLTEALASYAQQVAMEENRPDVGDTVELEDPKSSSSYGCAFTGTVVDIKNGLFTVQDMEDNCFDVDLDEIASVAERG